MKKLFLMFLAGVFVFMTYAQDNRNNDNLLGRNIKVIDYKNKENVAIFSPMNSLGKIIHEAVTTGRQNITINAFADSALKTKLSPAEITALGGIWDTIVIYPDPHDMEEYYDTVMYNPYNPASVNRFLIIEDSLYDQDGQLINRIHIIAPLYHETVMGVKIKEYPLYYVRFSDLIPILSRESFVSATNMSGKQSFLDLFSQRLFIPSYFDKDFIKLK